MYLIINCFNYFNTPLDCSCFVNKTESTQHVHSVNMPNCFSRLVNLHQTPTTMTEGGGQHVNQLDQGL